MNRPSNFKARFRSANPRRTPATPTAEVLANPRRVRVQWAAHEFARTLVERQIAPETALWETVGSFHGDSATLTDLPLEAQTWRLRIAYEGVDGVAGRRSGVATVEIPAVTVDAGGVPAPGLTAIVSGDDPRAVLTAPRDTTGIAGYRLELQTGRGNNWTIYREARIWDSPTITGGGTSFVNVEEGHYRFAARSLAQEQGVDSAWVYSRRVRRNRRGRSDPRPAARPDRCLCP